MPSIDVNQRNQQRFGLKVLTRITDYKDPERFCDKNEHLRPLFAEIQAHGASDIFIQEGKPVCVLVNGRMYAATNRVLERSEAQFFLTDIGGQTALASINEQKPVNKAFGLFDDDREKRNLAGHRMQNTFRVNGVGTITQGIQSFQLTLRTIPHTPMSYDQLGLNKILVQRCCPAQGIVLVAGKTGSGKSTTLAAVIRYILENHTPIRGNIITHEEPIEFVYDEIISEHSIVVQSQIPDNFKSFVEANREAMRRKPAAILVGELRDRDTIKSSIEATLTGHPVFGTVHSSSITEILPRILNQFSSDERQSTIYDFISSTAILIAQRLIPKIDGKLMAVHEYLYFTPEIRADLLDSLNKDHSELNLRVAKYMKEGSFDPRSPSSPTFSVQGQKLLAEGIINQEGFSYLINNGEMEVGI